MFYPKHNPLGSRSFRIAFANIDKNKISTLLERLKDLSYQRLNSKNNDKLILLITRGKDGKFQK